ncbi:MAG: MlaD family protein [Deltaproteobacteria bacterium]|nr:MlaD family protein [Deltaproteobacteria bacterium]
MRNLSSAFKVGLLLIVAIVGSVFLYRVVVQRGSGAGGYRVYALFRDASGLVPRSRVTMAGIPVGRIDTIRLQDGMARVEMVISREVELYDDATVSRKASSLLGEFLMVLAPGTAGTRRIGDGERVRVLQEGATTDDILQNVNAITRRVRDVTDRVGDVFGNDEGRRQMAEALRNLTETTQEINRLVHANSEAVTHTIRNVDHLTTEADPRVQRLLANLERASQRVDTIVADNQPNINDTIRNVQETMRNANAASRDLRESLGHVNSVTAGIDRGEGTVGRLVRDDHLVNEVEGVAEGLNDLVAPIGRLQLILGLRTEYNFVINGLKSYLEFRLQPREDRHMLFQIIDDPRGIVDRRSVIRTSTNPADPAMWRETTESTQRGVRFTLQFARRLGPATFRFGIMESVGGIGVDLNALRDRVEVRTDLFDFSTSQLPRLRVMGAYAMLQHVYVLAGVDDVLNPQRADVFLGAQLRFRDDDLRTLLLFAGGLLGTVAR